MPDPDVATGPVPIEAATTGQIPPLSAYEGPTDEVHQRIANRQTGPIALRSSEELGDPAGTLPRAMIPTRTAPGETKQIPHLSTEEISTRPVSVIPSRRRAGEEPVGRRRYGNAPPSERGFRPLAAIRGVLRGPFKYSLIGFVAVLLPVGVLIELRRIHNRTAREEKIQRLAKADSLLDKGKEDLRRRDFEAAILKFQAVAALDPDGDGLQYVKAAEHEMEAREILKKGEAALAAKHWDEARSLLQKVGQDSDSSDEARQRLAGTNDAEAQDLLDTARSLVAAGDRDAAGAILIRLNALNPSFAELVVQLLHDSASSGSGGASASRGAARLSRAPADPALRPAIKRFDQGDLPGALTELGRVDKPSSKASVRAAARQMEVAIHTFGSANNDVKEDDRKGEETVTNLDRAWTACTPDRSGGASVRDTG